MHAERRLRADLHALLSAAEAAPPVEAVDVVAEELGHVFGAGEVSFLIADFTGNAVVRFLRIGMTAQGERQQGAERAERVGLDGTVYERVLRTQGIDVAREADGARLIAPVTDRGDAIGLLELVLPRYPDDDTVADVAAAANALAFVVIANRRYTDLFEWGQRSLPLSLAAEIQHRLLPDSLTCEAGQFTLAARLEPSASVGGDTFDYSLDRDSMQLSITDAVGHQVGAAMLATVLVSSLRNARRSGAGFAEQARTANDELTENSRFGQFVTGQLMRVDLDAGTAAIVNAGHPPPLRVRDGRVEQIDLAVDMPFGIRPGRQFQRQKLSLQPGDRLVFLTDGMLERNAAHADVSAALADSAALHPREVVHTLGGAVLRATRGNLRDDAAVLCLDWYGGPPRRRETSAGASPKLASA